MWSLEEIIALNQAEERDLSLVQTKQIKALNRRKALIRSSLRRGDITESRANTLCHNLANCSKRRPGRLE
jgi:hypothetical protein